MGSSRAHNLDEVLGVQVELSHMSCVEYKLKKVNMSG